MVLFNKKLLLRLSLPSSVLIVISGRLSAITSTHRAYNSTAAAAAAALPSTSTTTTSILLLPMDLQNEMHIKERLVVRVHGRYAYVCTGMSVCPSICLGEN